MSKDTTTRFKDKGISVDKTNAQAEVYALQQVLHGVSQLFTKMLFQHSASVKRGFLELDAMNH